MMKYFFPILGICFFLCASCNQVGDPPTAAEISRTEKTPIKLEKDSLIIEELTRSFEYFIPDDLTSNPSLVFVLHGSGGNIRDTRMFTDWEFEKIAAKRGKQIIVYPAGYDKHWNDCRMNASYKANQENVNDLAFFSEMIEHFYQKFQINKQAVFVTGISNGGHMCYKLAYELPEKIKGIAPFVANIPEAANNDCTPKNKAVSVLIINGTNDPINPNEGGWVVVRQDSSRGSVLSTQNSLAYWKSLASCASEPTIIKYENLVLDDSSSVVHQKYNCQTSGKKVELLLVINGGHTVPIKDTPPLPENIKKIVGNKNRDINAPLIVLDFFENLI